MTIKRDIVLDLLAHLVAAVSLLSRSPKTAGPSDRMFDMMIADYERSIQRARDYLNQERTRS
jgi:hypothetical protein